VVYISGRLDGEAVNPREAEKAQAEGWFDTISKCSYDRYPPPGVTRPSYSQKESDAIDIVALWAHDRSLPVLRDYAGNLHCILRGNGRGQAIAFGSHVDSVPNGGRYDGVAGVVAGMCAIDRILGETLAGSTYTGPPLHLMVLRGEESAWFGKCYIGSLALFGQLPPECLDLELRSPGAIREIRQSTLAEQISARGGNISALRAQLIQPLPYPIGRFYEVHIEQGPELVERGIPVAVVSAIRGNARYLNARAQGEAGHSGTTPMETRQDAVMRFAHFLSCIDDRRADDALVTVGVAHTNASRNAVSIIADELLFALEVRSNTSEGLDQIQHLCQVYATKYGIELGSCQRTDPVVLDRKVQQDLMEAVRQVDGVDVHVMPSGAGHDAAVFQQNRIPTGMIFIRNEHGSHNPQEAMDLNDFLLAVDVLHHAIQKGI